MALTAHRHRLHPLAGDHTFNHNRIMQLRPQLTAPCTTDPVRERELLSVWWLVLFPSDSPAHPSMLWCTRAPHLAGIGLLLQPLTRLSSILHYFFWPPGGAAAAGAFARGALVVRCVAAPVVAWGRLEICRLPHHDLALHGTRFLALLRSTWTRCAVARPSFVATVVRSAEALVVGLLKARPNPGRLVLCPWSSHVALPCFSLPLSTLHHLAVSSLASPTSTAPPVCPSCLVRERLLLRVVCPVLLLSCTHLTLHPCSLPTDYAVTLTPDPRVIPT